MSTKAIIQSQYHAALTMLGQAIESFSDPLWADNTYENPAWLVAYHALYHTHLYLQPSEANFVPWEKHREDLRDIAQSGDTPAYTRDELLEYLAICLDQVEKQVEVVDLEAESGFSWLPFSKLELQFYNIRHIQVHTGELGERLGGNGEGGVNWVMMKD